MKKQHKPLSNTKSSQAELTRINIQLPQELFDDLQATCKQHNINFKDDLVARLLLSLEHNDILMSHDRLMRLIFCKKLSYEYGQRKKK